MGKGSISNQKEVKGLEDLQVKESLEDISFTECVLVLNASPTQSRLIEIHIRLDS